MTTTMKLYELAAEHRAIFDAIEDLDGELTPELEASLDANSHDMPAKLNACCVRIAESSSEAVAIQAEIDRLQARKARFAREATSLKGYVQRCLEIAGETRVDTGRFTVRVQASPPSAKWVGDPDAIPEGYRRIKTTIELDAKGAIANWKSGGKLPEGIEIRLSKHLVIK